MQRSISWNQWTRLANRACIGSWPGASLTPSPPSGAGLAKSLLLEDGVETKAIQDHLFIKGHSRSMHHYTNIPFSIASAIENTSKSAHDGS